MLEKLPQARLDRLLRIPLLGTLVARKVRQGLGLDRARVLVSGAAPIPVALLEWYRRIGLTICEGYGMTENFAYGNQPARSGALRQRRAGDAGQRVRIAENGEILCSQALMAGYYLEPEDRRHAAGRLAAHRRQGRDRRRWLPAHHRTGEGHLQDQQGQVRGAGAYRGEIAKNLWVEQVCLMGNGLDQPLALIELSPAARAEPRSKVEAELAASLQVLNAQLLPHERISHFVLVRESWTVDNGCMTPTMKIRRNVLEQRFAAVAACLDARQPLHGNEPNRYGVAMKGPLASLKILDFSTLLPGPFASLLLADMGAEVLRVESPAAWTWCACCRPMTAAPPPATPTSIATSAASPSTSSVPRRWRWCASWWPSTTSCWSSSARGDGQARRGLRR